MITDFKIKDPDISLSQRKCLVHILRNTETAITYLISVLENPTFAISHDEISDLINLSHDRILMIKKALEKGTFCALSEDECEFVAPFAHCDVSKTGNSSRRKNTE